MKYMLMFSADTDSPAEAIPPDAMQEMYAKVGEWWGKHSQSGAILEGHQLQGAGTATTVEVPSGTVTDGPFLEAKETIGGYAIVEAADLDTVITMARTWPASTHVEIRPLVVDGM